jgi:hypothetical protein
VVADWLLIAAVVALVIVLWFVIQGFIDSLLDYWRSYRDHGTKRPD